MGALLSSAVGLDTSLAHGWGTRTSQDTCIHGNHEGHSGDDHLTAELLVVRPHQGKSIILRGVKLLADRELGDKTGHPGRDRECPPEE